jgi:hypothetical protein
MIKQITYEELEKNQKIFQYHTVIKLNRFFEMLCDTIDESEYWSLHVTSPVITFINKLNDNHDAIELDSLYLLFSKELNNESIIKLISEYFYSHILHITHYDITMERLTHADLTEHLNRALEYQNYPNLVKDYSQKIWWNSIDKVIENPQHN